ncbi:MAG: hypothetical protein HC767_12100 [Akkermansiaceae bacterium]|nr:hypothetical protein [Akkermansiaceae bacterium]
MWREIPHADISFQFLLLTRQSACFHPQPQQQQHAQIEVYTPLPDTLAASYVSETPYGVGYDKLQADEPLGEVFGKGGAPEALDFDIQEVLKDTDMVGDDVLVAAWAP